MKKTVRCFSYAMIGLALILAGAQTASAHTDPSGATATGVSVSLTAFRADGITPVFPGTITQCETIIYRATLSYNNDTSNGINAAFFGGTLNITTPDAVVTNVTPDGGIPCLGGNDIAEGCDPAVDSVVSKTVSFTANATCTNGSTILEASVTYAGGTAHISDANQGGVGGTTPFSVTAVCCAQDGLFCNGTEFCDPALVFDEDPSTPTTFRQGTCTDGPDVVCTSDNNACNGPEACDEEANACASGPAVVCNSDGNACNGPETCDPTDGSCDSGPAVVCNSDGNACNGPEVCDPTDGSCDSGPAVVCADLTCTACVPATGLCDPISPVPAACEPGNEICRTPGFFGSHAGDTKANSTNITLALLNAYNAANDPNLFICGREITNTDVGSVNSALEAICVSVKGDSRRQLARQLTAAALNCILTNAGDGVDACVSLTGDVCAGVSVQDDFGLFDACNAACAAGDVTVDHDSDATTAEVSCIGAIDCFNNGGIFDAADGSCDAAIESCHDRALDNGCTGLTFTPPGPAGSPRECNEARKNEIVIPIPLQNGN